MLNTKYRFISTLMLLGLIGCGSETPATMLPYQDPSSITASPFGQTTFSNSSLRTTAAALNLRQPVTLAVIDTGVDLKHKDLSSLAWINPNEVANNGNDDDKNGYVDDVNGWNFTQNNNETADYSLVGKFSPDVKKFLEISAKNQHGAATNEEIQWAQQKRNDQSFMNDVEAYANFAHATHVAGIATQGNPQARVMSLKIISTKQNETSTQIARTESFTDSLLQILLSQVLGQGILQLINQLFGGGGGVVGGNSSAGLTEVFSYAAKQNALVANCSFAITKASVTNQLNAYLNSQKQSPASYSSLSNIVSQITGDAGQSMTTDIRNASNTLFVIAAGNETNNNDSNPTWPANVKTDNAITVAATIDRVQLASFSNYGATTVDVAAPGVAILSTAPGDEYVYMSGTSMAAPYVANIAAKVRSINPKLTAAETRRILIETVDVKEFLRNKVASAGIVNGARAEAAAELSTQTDIVAAIAQAKTQVSDEQTATTVNKSSASPDLALPIVVHHLQTIHLPLPH